MFDIFGEFNSAEEINVAAAAQLQEGDTDAVMTIARENGIDAGDAQDYIDGMVDKLCSPLMAAFGKIEVETEELQPKEIIEDWVTYIKKRCTECEDMAVAVRTKGKSVKGCIAALLKWSFSNSYDVDKNIVKQACIRNSNVKMGIPGMATAYRLIDEYYLGGDKH